MIYFLINNDYHLDMDLKLAKELKSHELGLIQVPYVLKVVEKSDVFKLIYSFPDKIVASLSDFIKKPNKIRQSLKSIDAVLLPRKEDVLLVHTEIEMLNQYIIQKFFNIGAQIYLLEDGTATMCTYNIKATKAPLKDILRNWILRNLYGFRYTTTKRFGAEVLPVMNDSIFKGAIVNYGKSILRDIECFKLKSTNLPIKIQFENGAIFFGQGLYFWFLQEVEYVNLIKETLVISKQFSPFYFKFHPADTDFVKNAIVKFIEENYPEVLILKEDTMAEELIHKFPVQYVITFNSTAALNVINKGVIPIFINNLLNIYFPNPSLSVFNEFLKSIKCNVPSSLSDIKPGFIAFQEIKENERTYTIREILNLK